MVPPACSASARAEFHVRPQGKFGAYCIAGEKTDAPLGGIFLSMLDPRQRIGGVGYWVVLPEACGRGVARHALGLITCCGFGSVGLHRIELGHAVGHEASCHIAVCCGCVVEGPQCGALPWGEPRTIYPDLHLHARPATDSRAAEKSRSGHGSCCAVEQEP